jgi:hypothetical protein
VHCAERYLLCDLERTLPVKLVKTVERDSKAGLQSVHQPYFQKGREALLTSAHFVKLQPKSGWRSSAKKIDVVEYVEGRHITSISEDVAMPNMHTHMLWEQVARRTLNLIY